jgi:hypothetical protein
LRRAPCGSADALSAARAAELLAALQPHGYEGVFAAKARARRLRCPPGGACSPLRWTTLTRVLVRAAVALVLQCNSPCEPLGFPPDGLALFYRAARLTPRAAPVSAFFTGADGCPLSQCRLLAPLHDSAADRCLLVATTHLKAKAGAAHDAVRLAEAQQV